MKCLLTEQLGQQCALRINIAAGFNSNCIQLTFKHSTHTVDFSHREILHEFQNGISIVGDTKLTVWFVAVGCNFGHFGIWSDTSRNGDVSFLQYLCSHSIFWVDLVFCAIGGYIQVRLIYTSTFEERVVLGENSPDFLRLGTVFLVVYRQADELRTQFHGYE